MRFALAAVGFVFAACTDALPCSTCPEMEGAYAVSWEAPTGNCAVGVTRTTGLNVTRVGSSLHSTVAGQQLTGTLYDTYDFSLSGGIDVSYTLRGRLALGAHDAGAQAIHLVGTLRTSARGRDAGTFCDTDEKFTADKI